MAALAERRIIPHEELVARAEEKSGADAEAQASAEVRPEHMRLLEALLFAAAQPGPSIPETGSGRSPAPQPPLGQMSSEPMNMIVLGCGHAQFVTSPLVFGPPGIR